MTQPDPQGADKRVSEIETRLSAAMNYKPGNPEFATVRSLGESYSQAMTDLLWLMEQYKTMKLERDQQERFKWAANERADAVTTDPLSPSGDTSSS